MAKYKESDDVRQMLGEFDDFLYRTPGKRRNLRNSSSSLKDSILNVATKLSFEQSCFDSSSLFQNESYSSDLRKMLRDKDVEIISLKNSISKLETQLSCLQNNNKRARIEFDSDLDKCKGNQKKELDKFEDMQLQFQTELEKKAEILQEYQEFRKNSTAAKERYEKKIKSLERAKTEIESSLGEELESLKMEIFELRSILTGHEEEVVTLRSDLDESKEMLSIQTRKNRESLALIKEVEEAKEKCRLAEIKNTELRNEIIKLEEANILARTMHSQLQKIPELEAENERLKEENRLFKEESKNILLLEEKNDGLQKALERAEKRYGDLLNLQNENEELKSKIKQWETLDPNQAERSPQKVAHQIIDLRQKEATYLAKLGSLTSIVKSLEKEKKSLELAIGNCKKNARHDEQKIQQTSDSIKRLQKKLLLVSKERDSYKRILDSYENEVTITYANSINKERLDEKEIILERYRNQMETLESDLAEANKKCLELMRKTESEYSEKQKQQQQILVNQLKEKVQNYEQQCETLQLQIMEKENVIKSLRTEKEGLETQMEYRALKGDYNPATTKVVHFKMNPFSVARQQHLNEVETLSKENEALKERVRLLLEGREKDANLTALIEENLQHKPDSKELEDLKEQLKASELRNQRIKEAFGEKSQEFREVCYMLTGFRIDMTSDKQYKLISMYAESPDDYLVFKLSSKCSMQLLETQFLSQLDSLIDTYLKQHESIPAFLSALTLELYSQQTQQLNLTTSV